MRLSVRPGRVCTTKHCRSSKIISRDILLAIVSLSQRNILIANLSFIILITNENRIRFCFIIIIIIKKKSTKDEMEDKHLQVHVCLSSHAYKYIMREKCVPSLAGSGNDVDIS